jgi:hypothetical protein
MSQQLIYYIALSAPPTRREATGREPFLRPEVGFNPSWFHEVCEVDFSEKWHHDPEYRMAAHARMRAEVRKRFPGRDIGGVGHDAPPDLLTGLFAGAVVAALYGQSIRYFPDKWPAAHSSPLQDQEAASLGPPDFSVNRFFQGILDQMEKIERLTGTIRGFLNWQGVLNTAFRLRGQQIFIDMIEDPGLAGHVFACVAETMTEGMRLVYERQRRSGVDHNFASISNCVVNMISPGLYREQLLTFDCRIRSRFPLFGIHNCAWKVDPYLDAYREIPRLAYLDMGLDSDLLRVRKLFPEARRNVLITSMYLSHRSEQEIREDFERIARDLGPCDVGLPDIEWDVPDDRVRFVMDLCDELSDRYARQEDSKDANH